MLQQILEDMFIDPDLLQELDEEQKQVLFCKMREEQLRRWAEKEAQLNKEDKNRQRTPRPGRKTVDFLLSKDGQPWVWVMGEHKDDLSIEEIIEREAQSRAELLAEEEAEAMCREEERRLEEKEREEERQEQERQEQERRQRDEARKRMDEASRRELEKEKQKAEEEAQQKLAAVKMRTQARRSRSITEAENLKEKRSSQILINFKEARNMFVKQAEESSKKMEEEWQKQEKMSKLMETERRNIARKAREDHRRSIQNKLKTESMVVGMFTANLKKSRDGKDSITTKPAIAQKPHKGTRPANKKAVCEWYRQHEEPRGTGMDPQTHQVATWFHGLITRQEAESQLETTSVGSFLVRVSEKVWGYAISYRGEERFKHFLIDASEGHYQFFGTNQVIHNSLSDLIEYHKTNPISMTGKEVLHKAVGQSLNTPDYSDLLSKNTTEVSYL